MGIVDIKRGDLYWVDFGHTVGSEQGGKRPALIVQNNVGNAHAPTTIVIPLTSNTSKRQIPTHGLIRASRDNGLNMDSIFAAEQPRVVCKSRLMGKIGSLSTEQLAAVDIAISISLGLRAAG